MHDFPREQLGALLVEHGAPKIFNMFLRSGWEMKQPSLATFSPHCLKRLRKLRHLRHGAPDKSRPNKLPKWMGYRDPGKKQMGVRSASQKLEGHSSHRLPRLGLGASAERWSHQVAEGRGSAGGTQSPRNMHQFLCVFFCCALIGTDSDAFFCKSITHEKARDRYYSLAGTPRNKGSDLQSKPR